MFRTLFSSIESLPTIPSTIIEVISASVLHMDTDSLEEASDLFDFPSVWKWCSWLGGGNKKKLKTKEASFP